MIPMLILWVVAFLVMLIIEAATLGLTTVWFAGGALVAAIITPLGAPIWLQIIVFIVVSVVLLIFTRPIVAKHFNGNRAKTNVESLAEKKAYVTEEVDNIKATGKVKVDGMDWSARTAEDGVTIPMGSLVKVLKVEGVKAIVEAIKEE